MEANWARGKAPPFLFMPYFGAGALGRGGAGKLQPVYVKDVARAFVQSLASPATIGEVYPLGGPDRLTWPELHRISLSRNVLAALLEAAIAAVYLEWGFEDVEPAIVDAFDGRIDYASTGHVDSKTELQEALARSGRAVQYEVLAVEGPPHERRFVCAALIDGVQLGTGRGSTKKAAEQEAAAEALAGLRPGASGEAPEPASAAP